VTLAHSVCLLLGGSFDPAYTLTITALPSQVQPVTNKRNAMLLAKLLEESLGVPASRGLTKFVGVQEDNFAFNGKTAATEIEDFVKEQADDNTAIKRTLTRLGPKAATKRQSKRSMRNLKMDTVGGSGVINEREVLSFNLERSGRLTPPWSERGPSPPTPVSPLPLPDRFNMTPAIPMPPVPVKKTALDRKAEKVQKIGHRKSFITGLFSRQSG
jgi:Macrophage migration inhibitory factor (MIF)